MDSETQLHPVVDLSESSPEAEAAPPQRPCGRKRKRKNQPSSAKPPPLDDAVRVQTMLSKKCSRKSSGSCRDAFRDKGGVKELVAFRSKWSELHKLDQDEVAPRMRFNALLVSQVKSPKVETNVTQVASRTSLSGIRQDQGHDCKGRRVRGQDAVVFPGPRCLPPMFQGFAWVGSIGLRILKYIFCFDVERLSFHEVKDMANFVFLRCSKRTPPSHQVLKVFKEF